MGENGEAIAAFMFELMTDPTARNADRIEAAKWLGDRGFGRPIQGVDLSVNQVTLEDLFRGMATKDLEAMVAIYEKYNALELVESGEVSQGVDSVPTSGFRRNHSSCRSSVDVVDDPLVVVFQAPRVAAHPPQPPPLFTGPGPESRERYEARQRQQRVDKILKKHGISQPRGPWWRV